MNFNRFLLFLVAVPCLGSCYSPEAASTNNNNTRLNDKNLIAKIENKISKLSCAGDISDWSKSYYVDVRQGKLDYNSITIRYLAKSELSLNRRQELPNKISLDGEPYSSILANYDVGLDRLSVIVCQKVNLLK